MCSSDKTVIAIMIIFFLGLSLGMGIDRYFSYLETKVAMENGYIQIQDPNHPSATIWVRSLKVEKPCK